MTDLLIGRQPIFNRDQTVIGYELLYRTPQNTKKAVFDDGDLATGQVILNAFSVIGLDTLVGKETAFINITENFLMGKYPIPFPPDRVALEILESINVTEEILKALYTFSNSGYLIVLDDVQDLRRVKSLLHIAHIVKIDLQKTEHSSLSQMLAVLKKIGIRVLAEKVETQEDFKNCVSLGFDYFQGYFLCQPNIVIGKRLDTSRLIIIKTLARIQDVGVNFKNLEELISQDVTLGYKLLKLVNSAYFSTTRTVESIQQAIGMIGINYLHGWLVLLLMSTVINKPHELTTIALIRAKFCELLARAGGKPNTDSYFMTGLLSVMDALLDMPMKDVLENLHLSNDVLMALLEHKGEIGRTLEIVFEYEAGELEKTLILGLETRDITSAYMRSLNWAETLSRAIVSVI